MNGLDGVKEALSGLQSQTSKYGEIINAVGGSVKEKYEATHKVLAATLQEKLAPAAKLVNERLIKTAAAVAGVSVETIKARVQTELIKKRTEEMAAAYQEAGKKASGALTGMALAGLGVLAPVLALTRSGFAASAMSQAFEVQMQRLTLTVAGIFGPELMRLAGIIQSITLKIQNMTGAQKENLAHWLEGGFAALSVALILPKVVSGLSMATAGVRALSVAFLGLGVSTGGLLPALGVLVAGLAFLMTGTSAGRGFLGDIGHRLESAMGKISEAFEALRPALEMLGQLVGEVLVAATDAAVVALQLFAHNINATIAPLNGILAMRPNRPETDPLSAGGVLFRAIMATVPPLALLFQSERQAGPRSNRNAAAPRFQGFETDQTAAYFRTAAASIMATMGRTEHERAVEDQLGAIANNTDRAARAAENQRPPVVR